MNFEETKVFNFEGALRGMRNPMNSWAKSDSIWNTADDCINPDHPDGCASCPAFQGFGFSCFLIGPNDMDLARRLITAGGEHRKFLRQIFVCVDITAPLFFFKELDTYKVGTTANSTSTMHKLTSTPITIDCFETDDYQDVIYDETNDDPFTNKLNIYQYVEDQIQFLEYLRQKFNETKDKRYWKELIRWLPESWLQKRTITMNYENLRNMYHQRKNHKLTEWHSFCEWVETLPYAKEFIIN